MNCLCCSGKLLPHIGSKGLYWYCLNCRQAMPILETESLSKLPPDNNETLTPEPETKPNHQLWLFIPLQPTDKQCCEEIIKTKVLKK